MVKTDSVNMLSSRDSMRLRQSPDDIAKDFPYVNSIGPSLATCSMFERKIASQYVLEGCRDRTFKLQERGGVLKRIAQRPNRVHRCQGGL